MSPDTPQTSFRRTFTRRGTWYRPVSVPRILLKSPSNPPSPPPERRTGLKLRRTKSRCKLKRGSDQKSEHGKFDAYKERHSGLVINPKSRPSSKNRDFYYHREFKSPVLFMKDRADELDIHQPNKRGDFLISKCRQNEGTHSLKIRKSSGKLKASDLHRSSVTQKSPTLRPGLEQTLSTVCPASDLHISTETPAPESGTNAVKLHSSTKEATLDNGRDISQPCPEMRDTDRRKFIYLGEERGDENWPVRLSVSPITAKDIQLFIDPGRDQRAKLERFLKGDSIVQPNKSQKLPKVYQHTQKIRHKVNEAYNFPPSVRETSPSLIRHPRSESAQTKRKLPASSTAVQISGETPASECFPSLPKSKYGTSLLRRPTIGPTRPVVEEGEVFQDFAKRIDLKPLLLDDSPSKTLKFYTYHYPLLLEKLMDEDRDKYVDRRSVTPSLGPDLRKRGAEIGKRMLISNEILGELEKENADCYFFTELHDLTFDPRKWSFNLTRYK